MEKTNQEAAYFCHGMPGSEHDARLLQHVDNDVCLITANLLEATSADPISDVLKDFDQGTSEFADGKINVVGFSIGAMVAIKVVAARPKRVGRLTLISPAAPLSLGNFLPHMAGKPVFSLAMKHRGLLRALTVVQGLISSVAPGLLIRQLFAKCGEAEQALLDDPTFREVIAHGFSNSFRQSPEAYVGFVRSYVEDWSADLRRVTCPVELWHGDQDTWAPIAMSQQLQAVFGDTSQLNSVEDTEHYSTLAKVSLAPLT